MISIFKNTQYLKSLDLTDNKLYLWKATAEY